MEEFSDHLTVPLSEKPSSRMHLINVVFPIPFSPIIPTLSPELIVMLKFLITSRSSYDFEIFSISTTLL